MIREKLHLFEWQISKEDLGLIYMSLKNSSDVKDCRLQVRKWEIIEEIGETLGFNKEAEID